MHAFLNGPDPFPKDLMKIPDGRFWAAVFARIVRANPALPLDEVAMGHWFDLALKRGYEAATEIPSPTEPIVQKITTRVLADNEKVQIGASGELVVVDKNTGERSKNERRYLTRKTDQAKEQS